ncbi:hypothetical protein CMK14_06720 [Candidatus Poribacteria bacterium]|nr:hypothetical protein [Candidatus Poribacteria bacterium]
MSAQWHPSKNGELTSENTITGSNAYIWWKCDQRPDHE